jgi:hypothetical protein
MSMPESQALRAFLLHRLSDVEAQALEERLMEEDGFLELLQDTENDLLDDYACGRLSEEDRASVERHLLAAPEALQRLEFSRALARARGASSSSHEATYTVNSAKGPPRPNRRRQRTWQLALAAAASILIVVVVTSYRFNTGDSDARTALLLLADSQRGTASRGVQVDKAGTGVRLQVEIPMPSRTSTYRIDITDRGGRNVYEAGGLHVHQVNGYSVVDLFVPGRSFEAGLHTVILGESKEADPSAPSIEVFRWQVHVNPR